MELKLEQLTKGKDSKKAPVAIPADEVHLGSFVYVFMPTSDDRDLLELQWTSYQQSHGLEIGSNVGFRKFLVAYALCDKDGNRMLDPGTEENRVTVEFIESMEAISENTPLQLVARIFAKTSSLWGFSKADLEALEGNSVATTEKGGNGSKPPTKAKRGANGSAKKQSKKSKSSTR